MENSNLIKQAKSDIFSELYPIINFYVNKCATPQSLKKYYRNSKRFNDILDDIKNKGSNIITDDIEYKKLVKTVLYEILDDLIAKVKDDEYKKVKMKHIKEFNSYNYINESFGIITSFAIGFFLYKFLKSILNNYINNKTTKDITKLNNRLLLIILSKLKSMDKIPVIDLSDRYFIRLKLGDFEFDIRVSKNEKTLEISGTAGKSKINLTDDEYNNFLNLIKK